MTTRWHHFTGRLKFPEVFSRENPGFDVFVGNPPFAGHATLSLGTRVGYTDFLRMSHLESGSKCDIVVFFFRRAFGLLRIGGRFGLIATNTIAQGDTRSTGLRWIRTHGGVIYSARKRVEWPWQRRP